MKRLCLILVILLVTSIGYGQPQKYFPEGVFPENTLYWYNLHLQSFYEESLYELSRDPQHHKYRFLVIYSNDYPVCFTLTVFSDGSGELVIKNIFRGKKNQSVVYIEQEIIDVSKEQMDEFFALSEQINFWEAEPMKRGSRLGDIQRVMEGLHNGKYHVIDRWSRENPDLYTFGQWWLKVGGMQ